MKAQKVGKGAVILGVLLGLLLLGAGVAGAATVSPGATYMGNNAVLVTWSGIVTGDTVVAYTGAGKFSSITADVSGTFAGGTTVTLGGSLDGSAWHNLRELYTGTAISLTAAPTSLLVVPESVTQIKPGVASGVADAITVNLLLK